jgi:DNA-binding NtrC family response regulator
MDETSRETPLAAWLARVGPATALRALTASIPCAAILIVDHEHKLLHAARGSMTEEPGSRAVERHVHPFHDRDGKFLGAIEVMVPARAEVAAPPADNSDVVEFHGIVTRDTAMRRLFSTVSTVARTDVTVLVRGESGTGKELFARALHEESHRKTGPFIAVNCAAMSPTLLESELFGHEKGAFTGALYTHHGVFERADAGTLFLDEVAELPLELQAKLLRVLEGKSFTRVGGSRTITADVRVVAATHRSLRHEVAAGRFREDLMYRLRVVPLFIPSLREREGDVPLLLEHFRRALPDTGKRLAGFSPDAMRALLAWSWPGNVRELKNVVEYAAAVSRAEVAGVEDLPPELVGRAPAAAPPSSTSPRAGRRVVRGPDEAARIKRALAQTDGNVGEAARLLGMSRPTFWRRRKALGV